MPVAVIGRHLRGHLPSSITASVAGRGAQRGCDRRLTAAVPGTPAESSAVLNGSFVL